MSARTRHVLIGLVLVLSFSALFPFALSQTLQVHGMKARRAYKCAYGVSLLLFSQTEPGAVPPKSVQLPHSAAFGHH